MPKPFQSCRRENDSIELAAIEFAEACIDIAPKCQQMEGRESMTQLYLTSQAACPDACSGAELLKFPSFGHERVTRILAFRNRAEIDAAEDGEAKLKEIEERLNRLRSPFRSAEKFWVEEIIDPRKTRSLLCEFARLAEPLATPGPPTNMTTRP